MDKKEVIHNLTIENDQIRLDDFIVKGVKGYRLNKSSAESTAELLLVIDVKDSIVKK